MLGGFGNVCYEFATKRYRSNCINWGILPFTLDSDTSFEYESGDCIFVPDVRAKLEAKCEVFDAKVIRKSGDVSDIKLNVKGLTDEERQILLDGCLMNYYKNKNNK